MKSGFVGLNCGEFCSRGIWSVFVGGMEPEVFRVFLERTNLFHLICNLCIFLLLCFECSYIGQVHKSRVSCIGRALA